MLIENIKLKNILSFGPEAVELELHPLNVLIGPNGSGKSNFIDVLDLIRSLPKDMGRPIRKGGGIGNWIWRGQDEDGPLEIEAILPNPIPGFHQENKHLVYSLIVGKLDYGWEILHESLEARTADGDKSTYFSHSLKTATVSIAQHPGGDIRELKSIQDALTDQTYQNFDFDQSFLASIKEPISFPVMTWMGDKFSRLQIHREWSFGRAAPLRQPQQADLRNDVLGMDGTNLGLVLNRLRKVPETKRKILDALRHLYDGITDYETIVEGGTLQIFVEEEDVSIPANRLSDGTLRYLCLLVVLCDPNPPPLVCIEEPELGLHPDILSGLTDLMRDASQRCQLVVTTHSDVIVDALTDMPESIVVCEKEDGQTRLRRLSKDDLSHWLEKYRLGELWSSGEIGGNRW